MKNYVNIAPKGIDFTIQQIQTHLFERLNWGNINVFGRVFKNPSKDEGKKFNLEAYIGNNEYKDVFIDDSVNANIFFIDDDVDETKDSYRFTNDVKIVFMVDLTKIYSNVQDRADMRARIAAIEILRKTAGFEMLKIEKGVAQIFNSYNTEGLEVADMQPFHVFAITGKISYQLNCFN